MRILTNEDGTYTVRIKGKNFRFKEGSCNSCPFGKEICTGMRDPRDEDDKHMDFMDFCQTLDIDNNIQPIL